MRDVKTVFVMGVSGVGKTTFGSVLAAELGMKFIDADDLHPTANKAKMAAGIALTDQDRWPWLDTVGLAASRQPSVVACSALRRRYREHLLTLVPAAMFIHLDAGRKAIAERVSDRAHEYMPASLLDSQLATLEPLERDEPGFAIDATMAIEALLQEATARFAQERGLSDL